jgi:hypothetical protein
MSNCVSDQTSKRNGLEHAHTRGRPSSSPQHGTPCQSSGPLPPRRRKGAVKEERVRLILPLGNGNGA